MFSAFSKQKNSYPYGRPYHVRILVLTNRVPYPLKDGGNVATMQMLESMLHCGFKVKLLSLNTKKHFVNTNTLPKVFTTLALETIDINTDVSIKGALQSLFSTQSYNATRFYNHDFKELIQKTLREEKYDMVHFENIYTAIYLEAIRQDDGTKYILRPHNIEHEIWEKAGKEESFIKRAYINLLARRLKNYEIDHWKKFDAIIPITAIDEAMIKHYTADTTHYLNLPTAIDLKKIPAGNNDSDNTKIFHLGSMAWLPNRQAMEWFITHVWDTIEKATKAHFYMAGRDMPEELFNFQSNRIHVLGEVDDAFEFMMDKQIMVVPLFAGSGVRIKILEGMAAAKTIVTTSIGVQGIDAFDKDQVVLANNPKAFADAVIWCVKNEQKCKEIGRKARQLIEEKYSIENFELKLQHFLLKVIN